MWIQTKILALLLLLGAVASQECDEANGWEELGESCFRISRSAPETQFTWQEARSACLAEGGELASIHSQEEQVFLVTLAIQNGLPGFDLWMGMNQLEARSGPFSWSDASAVDYLFWAPDMPTTAGLTHCAYTMTEEAAGGFTRYDYYSAIYGLMYPGSDYPWDADGIDVFYFGTNYDYTAEWCEAQCEPMSNCAAWTWYTYHWDYNWDNVCMGRSERYPILEYDSYATSGVRSLSGGPGGWWYSANCGLNKAFACKKAKGSDTPVTLPPTVTVDSYCPEGYLSADMGLQGKGSNKCFKIVSIDVEATGLRWEQALVLCRSGPGIWPDLASISSEEENALLTAQLRKIGWAHWIGMHYAEREQKFVWSDNSEASFSNFGPGEPQGTDACVEMWSSPGPPGTWNNNRCDSQRGYVCQTYKDPNNIAPTPNPSIPPNSCAEGWTSYWYACYKVDTEARTYQGAKDNCVAIGGALVSIHSEAENAAVFLGALTAADLPVWIGLQKDSETLTYQWADGWPLSYFRFDTNSTQGEGCVAMKDDSQWVDTVCGNTYPSVCKQTDYPTPTIPQAPEGYCPRGNWVQWGNRCYLFSTTTKTVTDALVDCQIQAGQGYSASLVSIESYLENDFLKKRMQATSVWTGLRRVPGTVDEFYWLDGTAYNFSYWAPGEPSDPINELCVEIFAENWQGMWNDCACDYDYKHYICEATLGPSPTYPAVPTSAPGECPTVEWLKYEDECLLVRPVDYRSWGEAKEICKFATGGRATLASVHNSAMNDFMAYNAYIRIPPEQDYYAPHAWIGLTKQGLGYPYEWDNGYAVNYTNWAPGEPNDLDGSNNCGRMFVSDYYLDLTYLGKWDDYLCSVEYEYLGYICMVKQGSFSKSDFPSYGKKSQVYPERVKSWHNRKSHKVHPKPKVHPDYLKHRQGNLPQDRVSDVRVEDSPPRNEEAAKTQQIVAIALGCVVGVLVVAIVIGAVFVSKKKTRQPQLAFVNTLSAESAM